MTATSQVAQAVLTVALNQTEVQVVLTAALSQTEIQVVLQEVLQGAPDLQEGLRVLLQEAADEVFNKNLV